MNIRPFITIVLILSSISTSASSKELSRRFIVTEDTFCLHLVSLYLYGTHRKYRHIAKWNNITKPYPIRLGQTLLLKKKRTVSRRRGKLLLLAFWRKRFGLQSNRQIASSKSDNFYEGVKWTSAEGAFLSGKQYIKQKKYDLALDAFRRARDLDETYISAWIGEIKTLRILARVDEEKNTISNLLKVHPELDGLPLFKKTKE